MTTIESVVDMRMCSHESLEHNFIKVHSISDCVIRSPIQLGPSTRSVTFSQDFASANPVQVPGDPAAVHCHANGVDPEELWITSPKASGTEARRGDSQLLHVHFRCVVRRDRRLLPESRAALQSSCNPTDPRRSRCRRRSPRTPGSTRPLSYSR